MTTYIIDTWTPGRRSVFLNACIRETMYTFAGPSLAINGVPQHGGHAATGDLLSITPVDSRTTVFYALDGTDPAQSIAPRQPGNISLVSRDMPKRILVRMPRLQGTGARRDPSTIPPGSSPPGSRAALVRPERRLCGPHQDRPRQPDVTTSTGRAMSASPYVRQRQNRVGTRWP